MESDEADIIGYLEAYGVETAVVRTRRPPLDIVQEAVVGQLESAGYHLSDRDAHLSVSGELTQFSTTAYARRSRYQRHLYWEVVGALEFTLEVRPVTGPDIPFTRRYRTGHPVKTRHAPSSRHFEEAMRGCLEELQRDMARDTRLAGVLSDEA